MHPLLLLVAFLLPLGAGAEQIIGGQEARPHSHPYMAYLQTQTLVDPGMCGGFLVQEDFVLTAARCWGSPMNVILGAHNIGRRESTQQLISVCRAFPHPEYNQQNHLNDIMLLQLENRATLNRVVRPVALPRTQTRLRPGDTCTVAGWGLVGLDGRTDTLQDVQLRVQRDQECSNRFNFYTRQTQICVGNPRERKSPFLGDTGGPLVCHNEAQGIISYGNGIRTPPAVFTRVSCFLPWIRRTMRRFKQQGQTETPL